MLTGTENTLAALIKSELESRINSTYGYNPQTPNAIDELTEAIAYAIIPHVISNTEVDPGTFAAGGDPVSGIGELV